MNWIKEKKHITQAIMTFFEAFFSVIIAMLPTIDFKDTNVMLKATLLGLLGSAISAGFTAVMTKREESV